MNSERIETYKGFEIRKDYETETYFTRDGKFGGIFSCLYRCQDIKAQIDEYLKTKKECE